VSNHIGILLTNGATQVSIGGPTAAQGNLISGNIQAGIRLEASGNTVRGNIIGMAADGMTRLGNGLGVYIASGSNNLIGGQSPLAQGQGSPELGAGNLISGNSFEGIEVDSDNNTLLGNVVGLAADGVTAAGNGYGISVYRAANNRIGDSLPGHRNVISANYFYGISVLEFGADGTRIWGNHIGTDVTGTRLVGNLGEGITVSNAYSTQIGGASPEDGNVIAGNGSGVVIHSRTGNLVRNNSIYANAGLGIDLDGDGITPNDPDDSDTGGNGLQNFPILHEAHFEAVPPRISGEFTSAPNTMYTLEFFVSDAPDPSGNGEGQRLLASGPLTLGASGSVEFQTTLTPPLPPGRYVTATATDPDGNTSEFSPWIRASGRVPTTEEIVEVLLGIIPDPGDLDLNTSGGVEAGDVVTSVNTTNH
jgi:parallel beta-helix repeat protein